MEWFDFAVYGYLAAIIGKNFFPSDDPTVSTIAAFGGFAAGYLIRPFGGAIFGHIADKYGTHVVLIWSVLMMGSASLLIALLPNYNQIGIWAPIALIILRMVQGFSVGGEFTGSIVYLVEGAAPSKRGFIGATANAGSIMGFLTGSGAVAILATTLTDTQMATWGWRIPFFFGVAISATALFMRRSWLEAGDMPATGHQYDELPLVKAFRDHWREMLRLACLVSCTNVAFYGMFVFAVSQMKIRYHVDTAVALDINTLNMAIMCLVILAVGWLSDKIGRKPLLFMQSIGLVLLTVPLSTLMFTSHPISIALGQVGFAVLVGIGLGVNPVTLVENTDAKVRGTIIGVGYNLTLAIFGGTTPLVASWLLRDTNKLIAPEFYMIFFGILGLAATLTLRETRGKYLEIK